MISLSETTEIIFVKLQHDASQIVQRRFLGEKAAEQRPFPPNGFHACCERHRKFQFLKHRQQNNGFDN